MVMAKKVPGHCEESTIARITVKMNTMTSTNMLHNIRVIKLPLKLKKGMEFFFTMYQIKFLNLV